MHPSNGQNGCRDGPEPISRNQAGGHSWHVQFLTGWHLQVPQESGHGTDAEVDTEPGTQVEWLQNT